MLLRIIIQRDFARYSTLLLLVDIVPTIYYIIYSKFLLKIPYIIINMIVLSKSVVNGFVVDIEIFGLIVDYCIIL